MFYLIENLSKNQSRVLAQHHDWQAVSDLCAAYQTIGRYEYTVVSDEFTLEDPALQENQEEQTEEESSGKKLVDPNSYECFKLKTQYCAQEVRFLIDTFNSPFTVADVSDLLNQSLKKHFVQKAPTQSLSETEIKKLLPAADSEDE